MGKKLGLGLLASGFIFLGFFFLPLGYDFFFYYLQQNFAGGSYWLTVRYMYMISTALIVSGLALMWRDDR